MPKLHPKTLKVSCRLKPKGLILKAKRRTFHLTYPKKIWQSYPKEHKKFLIDNLVYLLTVNVPFISGVDKIIYQNISFPYLKPLIDHLTIEGIPSAVHSYKDSTFKLLRDFNNYQYIFKDKIIKCPPKRFPETKKDTAIVPLSFGKDSLTTLGILRDLEIKPICVYINDTVSPSENSIKIKMLKRLNKEQNIKTHIVTNEIEKLNDFEFWNTNESCLGYMHMMMGFCLLLLPFLHFFRARYIALGNQKDMDFSFINKDGFRTYPAVDQTSRWTAYFDEIMGQITQNNAHIRSYIANFTNISLMRLLHKKYPNLAKYEVSCDSLDASNESRWCQNCSKCARLSIFMKAHGIDTKRVGFKDELLDKKHKKLYTIFNGKEADQYEESKEAREQQLLAFYLAYKRGERGKLIDYFKKHYLNKTRRNLKKLKQKYLLN